MDKQCVNYVGLACVDGSCPAAQDDYCGPKMDCGNCFLNLGCEDCALAGTEHCGEVLYHGGKE